MKLHALFPPVLPALATRLLLAASCLVLAPLAQSETFPSAPVKIVTPFAAGSGADIVARLIAQGMSTELDKPVVVENRVGAGGNVGVGIGAKAPADGYTLTLGTSGPLTVNPTLYPSIPFDPIKDFAPISVVAVGPMVVAVNASSRYKTLADLLAAAKASPNSLNYGTPGVGSAPHLAAALLLSASGTSMTHIPFKGNNEAITELVGGRLDAVFSGVPSALALAKAGKLRLLAATGPTRSNTLPDVPSIAESGLGSAQCQVWYGLLAPAQTPPAVIERLHASIAKALQQPGMKEKFTELGLDPALDTPQEFHTLIRTDGERLGKVIRAMGMKAE